MEDKTLTRLIDVSHKREDNLASPLILQHYDLMRNGFNEKDALTIIESQYEYEEH